MFVPEMWASHTATCALKLLPELKEYTDSWGKTNTTITSLFSAFPVRLSVKTVEETLTCRQELRFSLMKPSHPIICSSVKTSLLPFSSFMANGL